jgi:hypothetical protein
MVSIGYLQVGNFNNLNDNTVLSPSTPQLLAKCLIILTKVCLPCYNNSCGGRVTARPPLFITNFERQEMNINDDSMKYSWVGIYTPADEPGTTKAALMYRSPIQLTLNELRRAALYKAEVEGINIGEAVWADGSKVAWTQQLFEIDRFLEMEAADSGCGRI